MNFATEEAALSAANDLNGKFIQGSLKNLRIEPYQRANRFFGALMGLNRNELLSNTHFRVLFIKNIQKNVTREQIKNICEKYGEIETFTLKTKIEN